MKTAEHQKEMRHGRFEEDLEATVDALFLRCPTLCGFSVRDAADLSRERNDPRRASDLYVTEVSTYPMRDLEPPPELCHEIVATLAVLIDECPEAGELLRERTFARVFH